MSLRFRCMIVFQTIIKVQNNFRAIVTTNPRNHGHMVDGIDSPANCFQQKAVELGLYSVSFIKELEGLDSVQLSFFSCYCVAASFSSRSSLNAVNF